MSKKRLIINEEQLKLITKVINEDNVNNKIIIKQVVDYLKKYYKPSYGTYKDKGGYNNIPMIQNQIDEELLPPENVLRHLKEKFNVSPDFLAQIVRDWYDGKLNNEYMLSKNVSPNN